MKWFLVVLSVTNFYTHRSVPSNVYSDQAITLCDLAKELPKLTLDLPVEKSPFEIHSTLISHLLVTARSLYSMPVGIDREHIFSQVFPGMDIENIEGSCY